MAVLFCFSIILTGCGTGTDRAQSENNVKQADSAASPGTTSSEASSGDKSTTTGGADEPGGAASSEATSSQASATADTSQEATSGQTSPAADTSTETTGEQASQDSGTSAEATGEQATQGASTSTEPTGGQASQGSGTTAETTGEQAAPASNSGQSSETVKYDYFLAGSFNGYIANDPNFQMELVPGTQTWYTYTVLLTQNNRDELYDGHWYKVTTGDWSSPSYGIDNYCIKDPPIKYLPDGTAIGLGSIWVDENIELTVMFDSVNKIVYDNANGKSLPTP